MLYKAEQVRLTNITTILKAFVNLPIHIHLSKNLKYSLKFGQWFPKLIFSKKNKSL